MYIPLTLYTSSYKRSGEDGKGPEPINGKDQGPGGNGLRFRKSENCWKRYSDRATPQPTRMVESKDPSNGVIEGLEEI